MEYPSYLVHFNPNHDPKTGQFAPGAGGSTSNKIGARLKKSDLLDENYREYKTESGPAYKRMKAAADTGLKALLKLGDTDVKLDSPEHWDYWFLFEDQTYGQAQVADLANKGKSKEQIKQIIKDSVDFTLHNNTEYPEIPGVYSLYLFNEEADYMPFGDADSFIDACIEVAKENKQVKHSGTAEFGNYLCHFNRNHSSKNGQFTYGDGDNDGATDERGRRGRYKPEAIGTHGNTSSVSQDDPQQKMQKFAIKTGLKIAVGGAKWLAGKAFAKTSFGKQVNQIKSDCISVGRYTLANTDLKKAMATSNWGNYSNELRLKKAKFTDKLYDKATNKINDKLNEYSGG